MTKPTQLMPELLHIRAIIDEQWRIHGPDDDIVISRVQVERLIADNDRLKAENALYSRSPTYDEMAKEIARLREALEYIATNTTHYMHEWVRNYARTALEKK